MNLDPDRLYPSQLGNKVKGLILIAHLVLLGWALSDEFSLTFLLVSAPFLWFFVAKMGMEVRFHRYHCHKTFTTGPIRAKLLLILGTISSTGSSLTWVAAHRVHHRNADRPGDPQNPNTRKWWQNWLTIWEEEWVAKPTIVKDLMRDPWHRYIHRNYFKIVIAYIIALAVISWAVGSWYPIIVLWSIPVVTNFNMAGFLNSFFHNGSGKFGYRNYDTPDDSVNHVFFNLFMAGGGMHNNHHACPDSYTTNTKGIWKEADFTGWFIRNFLAIEYRLAGHTNVKKAPNQ